MAVRHHSFWFMATLGLVLCASSAASADGRVGGYVYDDDNFFGYVDGMSDFDQIRNGLPLDGKYYCAVASATNVLVFASNNGYPDVGPGNIDWEPESTDGMGISEALSARSRNRAKHESITDFLADLGTDFGTAKGTPARNYVREMRSRLPESFDFDRVNAAKCNANEISLKDIASALSDEKLVIMTYGTYEENGAGRWVVGSAHTTVVTGVFSSSTGVRRLIYRDPNSTDAYDMQDEFSNTTRRDVESRTLSFKYDGDNCSKRVEVLNPYSEGDLMIVNEIFIVTANEGWE
jgi:hypothetical protein